MLITLSSADAERLGVRELQLDETVAVALAAGGGYGIVTSGRIVADDLDGEQLRFWSRFKGIVEKALSDAPADDMNDRARWIRSTGWSGVLVLQEPWGWRVHFGGRLLVSIPASVFTNGAYFEPVPWAASETGV